MPRALPAFLLALTGCCPTRPAATAPIARPPDPSPLPVAVQPAETKLDGGTLAIAVGGAPAGTEGFEIRRVGDQIVIESHIDATLFGSAVRGRGTLYTDAQGRPRRGELLVSVDGVAVATALAGGPDALVVTIKTGDAAAEVQRAPGPVDLYLDNASFAHLAPLCAATAATVTAFPGTLIAIGDVREAGGVRAIAIDVAGALKADLFCDGARFLGADIPLLGLTVTRTGDGDAERLAALRRQPRQKPPLPAGLVELDRTVDVPALAGGSAARLACTLLVPASHAAVTRRVKKGPQRAIGAVTFVTGSGNQDRDEDSYGPGGLKLAIFKTVAIELGKAGIASLRCDDRGGGGSTGDFATATLATFVADAAAVLAALREEPAIDPNKIGIVGHSEGGIIAPLVALAATPKPRALVLMAGTGRPFDVILQEQARRGLERSGKPAAEQAADLAERQAVYDALRAGKPLPTSLDPTEVKQYTDGQAWMVSHLRHDPEATAARLKGVAVLIAQGQLDQQVAVADAEALEVALKRGNKVVEKIIYPGLNHLFAPTQTGDIAEYTDPGVHIDDHFLADVVRFLKANL